MFLTEEAATKVLKKLKEFGYSQDTAISWLFKKGLTPFRTPDRLRDLVVAGKFKIEWADCLAKMLGQSCSRTAQEMRKLYEKK